MSSPGASTAIDPAKVETDRRQFLNVMYGAMWDNINRHILVVWESIAVLVAALGASFLSEQKLVAPDLASSLVVLASGWSIAHAIDAKGWFNRNLHIIRNIERALLNANDESAIHHFFMKGPRPGTMIEHLRIQAVLGYGVGLLVLVQHFASRVLPALGSGTTVSLMHVLPYICAVVVLALLAWLNSHVGETYESLKTNSPGGTPINW